MSAGPERAVVERVIAAPPEAVFALFTTAAGWARWQGVAAEVDARPGGRLRVDVVGDGFVAGAFEEVIPPRRLVFTWGWEAPGHPVPAGSSRVEIDLEPDPVGTRLRLVHTIGAYGFGTLVADGWNHYLDRLARVARGEDPGRDPWLVA